MTAPHSTCQRVPHFHVPFVELFGTIFKARRCCRILFIGIQDECQNIGGKHVLIDGGPLTINMTQIERVGHDLPKAVAATLVIFELTRRDV
jgi:hypothetical protein